MFIVPQVMRFTPRLSKLCDELMVTPGMRERKAAMEARADGFIALPGGFYDPLVALFEHIYEQRFAKPVYRQLYHVAATPAEAMAYLSTYAPPDLGTK